MEPPTQFSNYPRPTSRGPAPVRPPDVYLLDGLAEAWGAVSKQLGVWVAMAFLSMVLGFGPVMAISFIEVMAGNDSGFSLWTSLPIMFFVMLVAGMMAAGVKQLDGETIGVGSMFLGLRRFFPLLGIVLLSQAASLLMQVPFSQFTDPFDPRLWISLVALLLVQLLFGYPFLFAGIRVALTGQGPVLSVVEAFRRTWSPVLAMKFLALQAILSVLTFGGFCLCFVGALFVFPLYLTAFSVHYRYFYPTEPATETHPEIGIRPPF